MKRLILLTAFVLMACLMSAQKPGPKIADFENQQKLALQKMINATNLFLNTLQAEKTKLSAKLKTENSEKISQYIPKLKTAEIKNKFDPDTPWVTEVYNPKSSGVQPYGELLLIGGNLMPKSSDENTTVTIQVGSKIISTTLHPSRSTPERLWLYVNDFEGIIGPTQATLTVTKAGKSSVPVSITLAPELITKKLDFTKYKSQLISDGRFTYPLEIVNSVSEGKPHMLYLPFNDMMAVYHNFPYVENRTTEYRGSDEFFLTMQFKNNWKVKKVIWVDNRSVCAANIPENQHCSTLSNPLASPYIKVFLYTNKDLCYHSDYLITYILEGPKGTTYW
jgi:hypothetical protein